MHNQKCLLTESENVGIEDEEAEAEDDSDAKEESHRCVKLTPKISVQPTEGFLRLLFEKSSKKGFLPASKGRRSREWEL